MTIYSAVPTFGKFSDVASSFTAGTLSEEFSLVELGIGADLSTTVTLVGAPLMLRVGPGVYHAEINTIPAFGTSTVPDVNYVYYTPICVGRRGTFTKLSCRVTTGRTKDCRLGLYTDSNGKPDTKIVQTANFQPTSDNTTYDNTISQALEVGYYWTAWVQATGSPSISWCTFAGNGTTSWCGTDTANSYRIIGWTEALTYTSTTDLPATASGSVSLMAGIAHPVVCIW